MLILLAESKTMAPQYEVAADDYAAHAPIYEATADDIMLSLRQYSQERLAEAIGVSAKMARYAAECIYDFPNKSMGRRAMDAYTGVVFKALDASTLSEAGTERCHRQLRIVSSLYGWLRPADILKPYRFDFSTPLAPGAKAFNAFWRKDATIALVRYLQENAESEVANLLPQDASKCFDWKLIKRFAKVYVADFKIGEGTDLRTPHAGRLKELRGKMVRAIFEEGVATAAQLRDLSTDDFMAQGPTRYADHFTYLTD